MELRHWWFMARASILTVLLKEILPPSKDKLIVDVGCGTGGITYALSTMYNCVGIDPIPEAIESAKERFPDSEFICGYAPEDIPEGMKEADAVLLMDVLEHIEDDFLFTSKLLSTMKPGAYLILMAPADPELWGAHDKGFEHYRRYTEERLKLLWSDLPVKELLVSYCNVRLHPAVKVARARSRKKGKALGKNDTDISVPFSILNTLLYLLFSTEIVRLRQVLKGKRKKGFKKGVSVFAIVQREEGEITPRPRPLSVPLDKRPWMELHTN